MRPEYLVHQVLVAYQEALEQQDFGDPLEELEPLGLLVKLELLAQQVKSNS